MSLQQEKRLTAFMLLHKAYSQLSITCPYSSCDSCRRCDSGPAIVLKTVCFLLELSSVSGPVVHIRIPTKAVAV